MKFPNKIFPYKESVIYHMEVILELVETHKSISLADLYNQTKTKIPYIEDFINALTCLYSIEKITIDETSKEILYAF